MAHGTKDDIDRVDDDDPRAQWPRSAKACDIAGITKRTLENRVRDGTLKYVYDSSGERRFDPECLNEVAGIVSDKEIDANIAMSVMTDLRRALGDMVKANKDLLTLATVPAFKAGKLIRAENRALRKRCRELEEARVAAIEAFEAALTEAHEREMARAAAEAHQQRLNKGFDTLMNQIPNLMSQLSFKKSIDKLFAGMTSEQKELLFEMLTPEQLAEIGRIMGQRDSDSKRSPARGQSDSDTNGVSSHKAEKAKEETS